MAETIAGLFRRTISYDKADAILAKQGGRYQPISSREIYRRVAKLHLALKQVGVGKGDRCAILSENRWEWAAADFAMMTAGVVSVPVYPTLSADQIHFVLEHSESRVVLLSTADQLAKVVSLWERLPKLEGAVVFEDIPSEDPRIVTLSSLIGQDPLTEAETAEFEAAAGAVGPADLASIIYTSGTTGTPKGVMLTHGNFASNVAAGGIEVATDDVALSFLPLSHVAERTADYTYYEGGATVAYAESMEAVPTNMREVRPTLAFAVPRFFEKVHEKVMTAIATASPVRRRLFEWALGVGKEHLPYRLEKRPAPFGLRFRHFFADRLVFSKLRGRLGGRFRLFVSGAAPLARHLAEFFAIVGVPVLEAYGLTETSPVISMNTLDAWKIGTVGKPIRGVEVLLADDGEILVRGPNVMTGYYKAPEATAETVREGWLHTGDVGAIDADGFLSITDRKKDLFKTSGGKYVAPAPIENQIKTSAYVSLAMVVAEGRNFPSAVIVPDFDKLKAWAKAQGVTFRDHSELVADERVRKFMMDEVARATAGLSRFEQPKKILLLDRELSIEQGEITPTMKVRRRAVEMRFARQIDALYS